MSTIRPILKLKFKTPPVKLEVYITDKANVTTKPKSANKINKNISAVTPDQEIIDARGARHKVQY